MVRRPTPKRQKRPKKERTPEERSRSAKKGWRTRNKPDNLYRAMTNAARKYRKTSQRGDYSRYRAVKRRVYRVLADEERSFLMCQKACLEADWEPGVAMKFAKLS